MKINVEQIFLHTRLFLRLCLPATVFIGLCIGILMAFNPVLLMLDQIALGFIGVAWLLLLILYIILGIVFTRFVARLIRGSFGSEELRIQRRMASLSGLPFYVLCLLCFMMATLSLFYADVNAVTGFVSMVGFFGFGLVSFSYLMLMRFFLGRSTAIAH